MNLVKWNASHVSSVQKEESSRDTFDLSYSSNYIIPLEIQSKKENAYKKKSRHVSITPLLFFSILIDDRVNPRSIDDFRST